MSHPEQRDVFRPGLFAGRTAFLAGATSGINLAIARRFAGLGARAYVISRDPAKVESAVALLGEQAAGRAADVRDFEAVSTAVQDCVDRWGAIDIVVSGAAGNFLALEWGPEGLRVNSIAPGPIAGTEGMSRLTPTAEAEARLTSTIPLGRYGDKQDIADLAVFLASDAARNISGALVVSDGGQAVGAGAPRWR